MEKVEVRKLTVGDAVYTLDHDLLMWVPVVVLGFGEGYVRLQGVHPEASWNETHDNLQDPDLYRLEP